MTFVGLIYLILAKSSGILKMIAMKQCGKEASGLGGSIAVNTVRAVVCLAVSLVIAILNGNATNEVWWLWLIGGIANGVSMLTWVLCATKTSLCAVEVFSMLGSVVLPLVLSPVLFPGVVIRPGQWLGCLALLVAAFLFTCKKGAFLIPPQILPLLLLTALSGMGMVVAQKLYIDRTGEAYSAYFTCMNFVGVLICMLAATLFYKLWQRKQPAEERQPLRLSPVTWRWIGVAAVTMYVYQFFHTMAAALMAPGILFPLSYGIGSLMTAVTDTVLFKEKLNVRRGIAIVLTLAGVILAA